jgi:hypothetical protein
MATFRAKTIFSLLSIKGCAHLTFCSVMPSKVFDTIEYKSLSDASMSIVQSSTSLARVSLSTHNRATASPSRGIAFPWKPSTYFGIGTAGLVKYLVENKLRSVSLK